MRWVTTIFTALVWGLATLTPNEAKAQSQCEPCLTCFMVPSAINSSTDAGKMSSRRYTANVSIGQSAVQMGSTDPSTGMSQ